MRSREQQAILTIALLAAIAEEDTDDREEEIKRIAQSLDSEHGADQLAQIYQDVLLKRTRGGGIDRPGTAPARLRDGTKAISRSFSPPWASA